MARDSGCSELDSREHARQRERMTQVQLHGRGIRDRAVLEAFRRVPRHPFVPASARAETYADHPLPIACGQTISQPYVVAFMLQALQLKSSDLALEIGTGSGYQTALFAELVSRVCTVEFFGELAASARAALADLGYTNVDFRIGDGAEGWASRGPFDAIIGSAAADEVPPDLVEQLAPGGRMILPVGAGSQTLILVTRTPEGVRRTPLLPVRFVPMQTRHG